MKPELPTKKHFAVGSCTHFRFGPGSDPAWTRRTDCAKANERLRSWARPKWRQNSNCQSFPRWFQTCPGSRRVLYQANRQARFLLRFASSPIKNWPNLQMQIKVFVKVYNSPDAFDDSIQHWQLSQTVPYSSRSLPLSKAIEIAHWGQISGDCQLFPLPYWQFPLAFGFFQDRWSGPVLSWIRLGGFQDLDSALESVGSCWIRWIQLEPRRTRASIRRDCWPGWPLDRLGILLSW